ncbi:hypothetical protein [Streptomyces kronopolitis]|uniref:hypothetical protein n=1 Tax=Streptomyces kronopolitis TaxID=1612435 RepID=UPI003F4D7DAD
MVKVDYFPTLKVVVGTGERVRTVAVGDLLPHTYVWADHQIDERDQIDRPDATDQLDRIGDRQVAEPEEQGPQSSAS